MPDETPDGDHRAPGNPTRRAGNRGAPAPELSAPAPELSAPAGDPGDPGAPAGDPGAPAPEIRAAGQPDGDGSVRFGPARSRGVLALVVAVVATGFAIPAGDPVRRVLALVVAAGLVSYGMRDLLVRVRLAAGPAGLAVVRGYAGHRRVFWFEIEHIRVDTRPRFGLRSQVLEIDVGETLYLFSASDLGVPCERAAETLHRLQPPEFRHP